MIHTLEADGILLEFGDRRILSDVYIKCETGKIVGLLGRNGNGKTSLLKIIYGDLKPHSKSIRVDGSYVKCAGDEPGLLMYLPQHNYIPSSFTLKRIFNDYNIDFKVLEQTFPEIGVKYTHSIGTLSGGQRRIVEIYLIIKSASKFAILDEPFSHLSPVIIEKIIELIKLETVNKGFLVTDHMYRYIMDISDDLYLLSNGEIHLIKELETLKRLGYIS